MFRSIGPMELIIILAIVLIIFGAGKLPQIGNAIGKGIREFRKASHTDNGEDKTGLKSQHDRKVARRA